MSFVTAARPREFLAIAGPDAADYLNRMVSNDVEALAVGDSCGALLLTAKARLIAPLRVWRRGEQDFLLLTEPGLGEVVRAHLLRTRFRSRCEIELEEHESAIVFGGEGLPAPEYGDGAVEVVDAGLEPTLSATELEARRILAGGPAWGKELDDRVLPAEAGLEERFISFTKGCYPGQEPVARLHYRGHPNRTLRVLQLDGGELPEYDAELVHDGKPVGRVTSAVATPDGVVALAYVRVEVPEDAELAVGDATARPLDWQPARP